jgi:hypothetical protein
MFKAFCKDYKMSMSEFVERAGASFIEMVGAHHKERVGAHPDEWWVSHDDLMINKKTDDIIISTYHNLTGRIWNPKDDRLGAAFNADDPRLVEIGMIAIFINSGGKQINSFKYFCVHLREMIDDYLGAGTPSEMIDYLLRRHREKLAKMKAGESLVPEKRNNAPL